MKRADIVGGQEYMANRSTNWFDWPSHTRRVQVVSTDRLAMLEQGRRAWYREVVTVTVTSHEGKKIKVANAREVMPGGFTTANAVAVVDLDEQGQPTGEPYALPLTHLRMTWAEYQRRQQERAERKARQDQARRNFEVTEDALFDGFARRMGALGLDAMISRRTHAHDSRQVIAKDPTLDALLTLAEEGLQARTLLAGAHQAEVQA